MTDETPTLSLPTLKLALMVLEMQQMKVDADDFEAVAIDMIRAKKELKDAIATHGAAS
jgi:hypothetical protein